MARYIYAIVAETFAYKLSKIGWQGSKTIRLYDGYYTKSFQTGFFGCADICFVKSNGECLPEIRDLYLSVITLTSPNACIAEAIRTNDPALLDQCPEVRENPYHFKTFRQYFSNSAYNYGWEVIRSGYFEEEEEEQQESFMENGLMGLKDGDGNVIIPALYDEVFVFNEDESVALVRRGNKYGYVDRRGNPVTELKYDDAYDTINGYAMVEMNGEQFLVQPGTPDPVSGYDDLQLISEVPQLYAAGNNGNYGVIDTSLQLRLPFTFRSDMEVIYAGDMRLLTACHTSGTRHFYTPAFIRIGDDSIDNVTWAGTFNDAPLLCISQFSKNKRRP